jgi:baculoviral IAP repeat-containing protein 6
MKALMIPAEDTPYAMGCFEFDIYIPDEYPNCPPKVLLRTTGGGRVRFNPNLYNEGKVCLSLLGTWPGEPWNPKVSNLLQVCNSILFLIFVEKPYFNEPGYATSEDTPAGDQASSDYNRVIQNGTVKVCLLHISVYSQSIVSLCSVYVQCEGFAKLTFDL